MRIAWLERLLASNSEQERGDRCRDAQSHGATPTSACVRGALVTLYGTLSSVTYCPRSSNPVLVATLDTGDAVVELRWMGRRRINAIEVGRTMTVKGRVADTPDGICIFNPAYELVAVGSH